MQIKPIMQNLAGSYELQCRALRIELEWCEKIAAEVKPVEASKNSLGFLRHVYLSAGVIEQTIGLMLRLSHSLPSRMHGYVIRDLLSALIGPLQEMHKAWPSLDGSYQAMQGAGRLGGMLKTNHAGPQLADIEEKKQNIKEALEVISMTGSAVMRVLYLRDEMDPVEDASFIKFINDIARKPLVSGKHEDDSSKAFKRLHDHVVTILLAQGVFCEVEHE